MGRVSMVKNNGGTRYYQEMEECRYENGQLTSC